MKLANRIPTHLEHAIKIMRNACEEAEREAKEGNAYAIENVLHTFAWAFANASSSIQTAMASAREQNEFEKLNLQAEIDQLKGGNNE